MISAGTVPCSTGSYARHRMLHISEPSTRIFYIPHRHPRDESGYVHHQARISPFLFGPLPSLLLTPAPPFDNRGTEDVIAPHGIPLDLLDRLLIIRTLPYTVDEIKVIVSIRARTEGLSIEDAAIDRVAQRGIETSLRWIWLCYRRLWLMFFSWHILN